MPRIIITIKKVRKAFDTAGMELLENKYVNAHSPLKFRCLNGHEHQICWASFQQGHRCGRCSVRAKLTIENATKAFDAAGMKLLEDEYIDAHSLLKFRCSNGHEHQITWNSFQQGRRCGRCSSRTKLTIEQVKEAFNAEAMELLDDEYINAHLSLKFRCSNGHEHQITWDKFQQGQRCAYCVGKTKPTIEKVEEAFDSAGMDLLENKYVNKSTPLKFRCSNGHEHQITWDKFQQGQRCSHCAGTARLTTGKVREAFHAAGMELLENEYINSSTPLKFRCSNGHEHQITWESFQQGARCRRCNPGGFNSLNPGTFYYIKIHSQYFDRPFYKVGITNKLNVRDRLKELNADYTIINTVEFKVGQDAYDYEQGILQKFSYAITDEVIAKQVLPISGWTELFNFDILNAEAKASWC
jgi:ribosomal protein S27E